MQSRDGDMHHPHDVILGAHGDVVTGHVTLLLENDLVPAIICVHAKNAAIVLRVGNGQSRSETAVSYSVACFRSTWNTRVRVLQWR